MTGADPGRLHALLPGLRADYPDWTFTVVPTFAGVSLEGLHPGTARGTVTVITDDPAELRRELDADRPDRPGRCATTT